MARGTPHIGTSGWAYDHWVGPFYPENLRDADRLGFYAQTFRSAEINRTFYSLPGADVLAGWARDVPRGFTFAVKASRYITHMKKLKDAGDALDNLLGVANALGGARGPLLFQLPPKWRVNTDRLADFLALLEGKNAGRAAFEFRNTNWLCEDVYALLRAHNAALCLYDIEGARDVPEVVTADFVYLRLHGPGAKYEGSYDGRTLRGWADKISRWLADSRDVFCYFDNDEAGYAVQDAKRLQDMIKQGA